MFISYAQNFEDVMLWRALKDVKNGFYIDVGAQDPIVDSISLAFYEHGWRGVHVEPTQQYSKMLRNARPDESVEQVAIGNFEGNLDFYEICDTGLSTASAEIARRHQEAGFLVTRSEISAVTLDVVLDRYVARDIHWLKIDVEGFEKSVLESWRASVARPWILVIESTRPLTQDENYREWESLVLEKGYCFAYFDGLNRFYVHQSRRELLQFFKVPPNIFDGFLLSGVASHPFYQLVTKKNLETEAKAQRAEAKAQQAEAQAQEAEAKAQEAEAKAQEANILSTQAGMQLQAVYASASWRVTAPIRFGGKVLCQSTAFLRNMVNATCHSAIENLSYPVSLVIKVVLNKPRIFLRLNKLLLRFPALHQQLLHVARQYGVVPVAPVHGAQVPASIRPELSCLTPRARQIYADLQIAIRNRQGRN